MSGLLTLAIEELAAHLEAPAGLLAEAITRVDVSRDGGLRIALAEGPIEGVHDRASARWFSFDDRGVIERRPERDARLPLAAGLAVGCRVLTYRPGRRVVVEEMRKGAPCIVKGYRKRRAAEAARRHRTALRACGREGFRVPLLVSHDRRCESLVFQKLEGEPLRLDTRGSETFFRIGAQLRELQTAEPLEPLPEHTVNDELGVLDTWRTRARIAAGALPERWEQGYALVRASARDMPPGRQGSCHRDLHDGQFLETAYGTALLDFDLLCRADVALDPANLLAHLALRGLQGLRGATPDGTRACGEALLEGYEPDGDATFWQRLRLFQAMTFLRLALLYSIRPRWARLAPALVRFAERCLEDVGHSGVRS